MPIQNYLPHIGGAELQIASLAPLLSARGVEVDVITRLHADLPDGTPKIEEMDGATVHRVPVPRSRALASLAYTEGALRTIARLRSDVVHAHELLSPGTVAVLAHHALRKPAIAKVLRGGILGDVAKLRRGAIGEVRWALLRRSLGRFVTISKEIENELLAGGVAPERLTRIPNGVDTKRFVPADTQERARLRALLGIGSEPLIVYTGRLVPEKRVQDLIASVRELRETHSGLGLAVVGSGPDELRLKATAGESVIFAGAVRDTAAWLRAADIFVLPSDTEGMSNALLEAMACGLPCVATRVGAAAEMLAEGHRGRLVESGDFGALSSEIRRLLDDTALARTLGEAARAAVVDSYSLESVADRLVTLYHELAEAA